MIFCNYSANSRKMRASIFLCMTALFFSFEIRSQEALLPLTANGNEGVSHVVIAWLKNPKDLQARKKFIETTKSFSSLPGVVHHNVGVVLPSDRKIVDSSFDVATVITFENRESLMAYLRHPQHKKAVDEVKAFG